MFDFYSYYTTRIKSINYYIPEWNTFIKDTTATLLLYNFIFWYEINQRKPFYKFIEPCKHPLYKEKDSISEELKISANKATKSIQKLISTKILVREKKFQLTYYNIDINMFNIICNQYINHIILTSDNKEEIINDYGINDKEKLLDKIKELYKSIYNKDYNVFKREKNKEIIMNISSNYKLTYQEIYNIFVWASTHPFWHKYIFNIKYLLKKNIKGNTRFFNILKQYKMKYKKNKSKPIQKKEKKGNEDNNIKEDNIYIDVSLLDTKEENKIDEIEQEDWEQFLIN